MKKLWIIGVLVLLIVGVAGCQSSDETNKRMVNLYTDRHYDTDQELYDQFTEETGIQVNVVKAGSDELIERLATEGEDTEADIMITSDAGRLVRAQSRNLLQPITSKQVKENVPVQMREENSYWTALTMRARVIVYAKDRVSVDDLSTYETLIDPEWKGKVLVRSAGNIYNQSLLASLIELNGEPYAQKWAEGLVENMARTPEGNDRDQMKAVVAGVGDVAIVNTYYVGKMLNSSDSYEVEVAEQLGVFFPNQETTGTHINISGAGVTRYAKHRDAANQLLEYLTGERAQADYANANYEYPVNPKVSVSGLLESWGEFNPQELSLSVLGENNGRAVKIFNKANWQ